MKKTLLSLIALPIFLMASGQFEVTQNNVDAINHKISKFGTQLEYCPNGTETMYWQSACVASYGNEKQNKLMEKILIALDYFKTNSIDILTTKTLLESSQTIFKDEDILLNQEATLEASLRYLKESERKDYKAVFISPKVVNGKYIVGQIMYGKIQ